MLKKLFRILHSRKLAINAALYLFMTLLVSYLAGKLPESLYNYKNWFFRLKKFENGGSIYNKLLRVRVWKVLLPEVSDILKFTFPKKYIREFSDEYFITYLMESCRSELTHWNIIFCAHLFLIWNDTTTAMMIILTAVFLNFPYIAIQRYNRPRIIRIIELKQRHRNSVNLTVKEAAAIN